jgi:nucleotide-binding universal stress UspA family protein
MPFLVAIDLSVPSRSAIELASRLARESGLAPLLLHVSRERPPLQLLADLYTLAEPLRERGTTPRLRTAQGDPATCICRFAREHRVAFVLMGTRGEGEDSVAQQVMATCSVPVLAVQPRGSGRPALSTNPHGLRAPWLDRLLVTAPAPTIAASPRRESAAVPTHTASG